MPKEFTAGEVVTYVIPLAAACGVFGLCYYLHSEGNNIATFYGDKMRASLFAGFLTLGSFLLALKTGIVIKIKEGVYDKEEYQAKVLTNGELSGQTVYGPLRRLSRLLSVAVFSALASSAVQLTLGLLECWWAASIAVSIATFALLTLMASFILIQVNLGTWFDLMEENVKPPQKTSE